MSPRDVLGGRYELDHPIGRGGNGEVWQARDRSLDRDVAVKVVDVPAADDTVIRRFRQEARAAAAITHPHVVAIHDADVDGAHAYLVMELLTGPTLAALLRDEGVLGFDRAADIAAQAADALEAVHRAGLVHRDVKPGNLVLDRLGRVKVVDFGIARLVEATGTQVTASGTVVGSAGYLSPEQARGGPATPASDHYALGCTLMTLLTGEPPFAGEHPLAVLRQHLDETPPRVSDRRPNVAPWLDDLVDDLLAKDPARRALGVAALLGRGEPAGGTLVMPAVPPPLPPPPPSTDPASRRRSFAPAAVLAAVAALLGLIVLVVVLTQGDDDPTDAAADPTTARTTPTGEAPSTPPPTTGPADTGADTGNDEGTDELVSALAGLRSAVEESAGSGDLGEKAVEDIGKRLEDLDEAVSEARTSDDIDRILDDIDRKLDGKGKKSEVAPAAAERIRAAIEQVRAVT